MIAIAVGFGCRSQPASTTAKPLHLESRTEILSVKATAAGRGYDVEAMLYSPGKDGAPDVVAAPKVWVKPNQWGTMKVAQEIKGYSASTSYWVGGEWVDVPAEAGVNLTIRAEPLADGSVWLAGIMALSKFDPEGHHAIRVFPVDVECQLGEAVAIHKTETEFDRAALLR